jgi:hypothetical protein
MSKVPPIIAGKISVSPKKISLIRPRTKAMMKKAIQI